MLALGTPRIVQRVLVLNTGSSSLKRVVLDAAREAVQARGEASSALAPQQAGRCLAADPRVWLRCAFAALGTHRYGETSCARQRVRRQ